MPPSRNNMFHFLILLLLGWILLGCGCLTEQPSGNGTATVSPTVTVPATYSINDVTFYTEQNPPFNYRENGTLVGISVDLLEAVTEKMGEKVSRDQVHLIPWDNGYQAALTQNNTALFTTVRLPAREQLFKWAGPIYPYTNALFARKDRNISITSPEDLKGYRIGVIPDDITEIELSGLGINQSQFVEDSNSSVLVSKLERGEIDLWGFQEEAGWFFIQQVSGNTSAFKIVYTLPAHEGYYAFNKEISDATVLSFQQALDVVKTDTEDKGYSEYEQILYHYLGAGCINDNLTDADVMNLVNITAAAIEKNATDTFKGINSGEAPYWDPDNRALYVFVFDSNVTVIAQGDNPALVGLNRQGKTDVTGRPFRDEIVAGALQNGTGWENYVYRHPTEPGLFYKTAYYRKTTGSDGKTYIVCSGKYKACGT
jgi:polar amino acid transport system substrate-binding protein